MRARPAALLLAGSLALAALAGCAKEEHAETQKTPENAVVYETRGRVVALPDPANAASDFLVRHEPIPAFKSNLREVEPAGMNSMVMPFPPAEGLDLSTVAQNDVLALTFIVEYDPDTGAVAGWELTKIEPLPEDTQLDLGKVQRENAEADAPEG